MSIHVKSRANAAITNFTTKLKQNGRWLTFLFERIIDSLSTKLLLHEISKLQRNNNIHKQKKLKNDIRNSVGLFNVVFFETGYRTSHVVAPYEFHFLNRQQIFEMNLLLMIQLV